MLEEPLVKNPLLTKYLLKKMKNIKVSFKILMTVLNYGNSQCVNIS